MISPTFRRTVLAGALATGLVAVASPALAAWEPT